MTARTRLGIGLAAVGRPAYINEGRDRDLGDRRSVTDLRARTCAGLDADVHEVKDHSLAAFTRQLGETRALLGRRLSIYHVHSATLETGALTDVALHRALAGLRSRGCGSG